MNDRHETSMGLMNRLFIVLGEAYENLRALLNSQEYSLAHRQAEAIVSSIVQYRELSSGNPIVYLTPIALGLRATRYERVAKKVMRGIDRLLSDSGNRPLWGAPIDGTESASSRYLWDTWYDEAYTMVI
jgi:hypothetical protein